MPRAWYPLEKEGVCAVSLSVGSCQCFLSFCSLELFHYPPDVLYGKKNIHDVFDEKQGTCLVCVCYPDHRRDDLVENF